MNIQKDNIISEVQQPSLPLLVKGSTTYKLFVPRKVEEKIRYLIRKFPSTEWSGVLFYTHTGKFEDHSLEIHCQDIFPMDLGSGTFTDFKMDESVVGYIAENIDLFGCDTGLVHSHHSMGAFFSGTDTSTLRAEGNDTNCFVSLIVDTKGTYQAAVTRKVQAKKEIITKYLDTSYDFFGEGTKYMGRHSAEEKQTFVDDTIIEYFMLDVEVEQVDNPLAYLDTRFEEIEAKKTISTLKERGSKNTTWQKESKASTLDSLPDSFNENISFRQWQDSKRKESAEAKENLYASLDYEEPTLFPKDEMDAMVNIEGWTPDKNIIHHLLCQMLLCSLTLKTSDIDLKQWIVKHMVRKYNEIFDNEVKFDNWKEFIVEFIVNQYDDPNVPSSICDDWDLYLSKIAYALNEELEQYPDNIYIEAYKETLSCYIYE